MYFVLLCIFLFIVFVKQNFYANGILWTNHFCGPVFFRKGGYLGEGCGAVLFHATSSTEVFIKIEGLIVYCWLLFKKDVTQHETYLPLVKYIFYLKPRWLITTNWFTNLLIFFYRFVCCHRRWIIVQSFNLIREWAVGEIKCKYPNQTEYVNISFVINNLTCFIKSENKA